MSAEAGLKRVLVVDDDHVTCSVIRRLLESAPSARYAVDTAADGHEALEKMRDVGPGPRPPVNRDR